jgi:N-acyl-D-amino-acid deacylase
MQRTVFTNVTCFDGTGAPPRRLDVWVDGPRIEQLSDPGEAHAGWTVVPGDGLALAPGFIDVHSHADAAPFRAEPDPAKVLQGVTTEVVGNCGYSLLGAGSPRTTDGHPGRYFAELDAAQPVTNIAPLIGHGTIRGLVMGLDARAPSTGEMAAMRAVLAEALDRGAFGVSSGLFYAPGSYADADELTRWIEGFADRPIVYASHIRNEGDGLLEAVDEFLQVGLATGVRLELSHHKAAGLRNWGKTEASLRRIAAVRAAGVDVALDVYPYTASSTNVSANLPPWVLDGGPAAALARLRDVAILPRIQRDCEEGMAGWESMVAATGYDRMVIASTRRGEGHGHTLTAYAAARGLSPFQGMVQLLVDNDLDATMVVHSMHQDDLNRVLADARCWIGSDAGSVAANTHPHPRLTGTFPRVLGRLVREQGRLTWAEAVYRMTGGPARHFHIPDRGVVRAGAVADLVLFDPARIQDGSTFEEPWRPPDGIQGVWIAGERVVEGARYVGPRNGRRLTPGGAAL